MSEAVIVHFDPHRIAIEDLIEIHLRTHSSTNTHSMRKKYRSAIYVYNQEEKDECKGILANLQTDFNDSIITQVLSFESFKLNSENYLNYYKKNQEKPFCQNFIDPKLQKLRKQYTHLIK